MRKMGLDVGDVRIGIALSDSLGIIAGGYETYVRIKNKPDRDYEYIAALIKEKEADTVVIGLPVNMDGTEGIRADMSRDFGDGLSRFTDAKIVFRDERLTTVQAERSLSASGVKAKNMKAVVDKVAAAIILQSYLDGVR